MRFFIVSPRPLAVFFCLLLWVAPLWAATLEDRVITHEFDNGLKLLMVPRPEIPTFTAYITLGVGSVHETSEYRGMAHMLEHMLFKGTQTIGTTDYAKEKPLLEQIEAVGSRLDALRQRRDADSEKIAALEKELAALQHQHQQFVVKDEFARIYAEHGGTGYNAFTSRDLTTYLVSLPANKLELWAAVESDRMKNPVLREFYTEREVVMEERFRTVETNPRGLLFENLFANAFTVHPYRNPILGWRSDIENLTLAQTRDFLQRYYGPVNTVIALVGDIDPPAAVAMIERYFGDIPPGSPVPPVFHVEPPQQGERRVQVLFDAEPQLAMAFHKPTLPEFDDYVFDLVNLILGQGRTSRLHRSLVLEQQLATAVQTFITPGSRYPNLFVIAATPRHPHTTAEVEAAIYAELERLAREPVSAAELERAVNRLRTDRLRFLRSNEGLARMLTFYQSVAGDWRYVLTYDDIVAEIDAQDVMETAARWLHSGNRTVVTLERGEQQP
ncbi:M16 family metallopeptidase [Geoalkalibacter halelectricus]|uniref:Insulinase family protein n=1 Tax=Geoalkalibacter halelectricus TaxID=2847045 RepID=A0ABY5ZQB3_9BACT|nr:pitrilysin family protein [Geoalkalibacter halelectricus]MDO3379267.1 insulinase family protein [Geoalkalibacter halelectricus]UWZ81024.1 insulinase family protein [Geoalkalibacter halelectricus]